MKSPKQRTAEHLDSLIAQYFDGHRKGLTQTLGQFLEDSMFTIASDPVLDHIRKMAIDPNGYEGMDGL